MAGEMICTHPEGHDDHICQLVARASADEIIDLVDLPGFMCTNCARAANSSASLCNPLSLDEIRE